MFEESGGVFEKSSLPTTPVRSTSSELETTFWAFSSSTENSRLAVGEGGEGRELEEKVDVIEGKEEEDEGDVEEREVDEESDDEEGGKTIGREFGGLESHREEPPSASNCSSVRMLAPGS